MNAYFKIFAIACSLLAVVKCSPIGGEEILDTSHENEDGAHRMLVWPPHLNKRNVSVVNDDVRLTAQPHSVPPTTIFRNAGAGEVQNKTDTHKEEEVILRNLEEQSNNESQKVNHTSESQSQNYKVINQNLRMTNWVNNLPKESNPGNPTLDIESIQLTTSEPQIIPSVETVAIFRNAGSWQNGNNSFSVEVEEITTNVTEVVPKNHSQTTSEPSKVQRLLESSAATPDLTTTEKTEIIEEIEVKKTHILESLEHNTEIYGKTAAEELAELSVIDVLLRKRRNAQTVKGSLFEFDSSERSLESSEEKSGEILRSGNPSSIPDVHEINITNVNVSSNINKATEFNIKSNTSRAIKSPEDQNNNTRSNPVEIGPLITLSEITDTKGETEIKPVLQLKPGTNNSDSKTIKTLQLTNSEVHPVYITNNTTHNITTSSELITTGQERSNKENDNNKFYNFGQNSSVLILSSGSLHPTANDSLTTNQNQTLKHNPSSVSEPLLASKVNKINLLPHYENTRRSDEGIFNDNSTFSTKPIEGNADNKTNSTPLGTYDNSNVLNENLQNSTTIAITKNTTAQSRSDKTSNEGVNVTTEVPKSNSSSSPLSTVQGKNLHNTASDESSTEAKTQTIVSTDKITSSNPSYSTSTTDNYNSRDSKHQDSTTNGTVASVLPTALPSETGPTITQEVTTSTGKDITVEKATTTEKETIFEGFKSIAEYIGFTD